MRAATANGPPPRAPRRAARLPVLWAVLLAGCFAGANHLWATSARDDYSLSLAEMAATEGGGDLPRRVGFLALAAAGGWGLLNGARGRGRVFGAGLCGAALAAFFLWPAASVVWSDRPALTARRVAVLGLFLIGVLGAAKALSGRDLVLAAVGAVGLHLAGGVAAELVHGTFRPWAAGYRFSGTIHPNIQALQLAAGICGCAALAGRDRPGSRWWLAAAGVFGVFLLLTKSRTATAGLLFALGTAGLGAASVATKLLALTAGVVGAAGLALGVLLAGADPTGDVRDAVLMGRTDQQESISGRLPIWEALLPAIADRPVCGYGYGGFWTKARVDAVSGDVGWAVSAAHSAWFEAALDGGLTGAAVLAALLVCAALRAAGRLTPAGARADPLPFFALALTLAVAANTLTEALVNDVRLVPFLWCAAVAKLTFLPDRPARPGSPR